jgi:hypothetical protein
MVSIHSVLDMVMLQGAVSEITDWVYSLQVTPNLKKERAGSYEADVCFGFRGSPSIGVPYTAAGVSAV